MRGEGGSAVGIGREASGGGCVEGGALAYMALVEGRKAGWDEGERGGLPCGGGGLVEGEVGIDPNVSFVGLRGTAGGPEGLVAAG